MANIFYQQSGRRGEADFPKTIVDKFGELRDFDGQALLEQFDLPHAGYSVPRGRVQLWGVPAGAKAAIKKLAVGDIFLLIGQLSPHGLDYARFFYAGRIVHVVERESFDLSKYLWGDQGFPLIFMMQGTLVNYSWREFSNDFNFKAGYYVAGQTMRMNPDRVKASRYKSVTGFAEALGIEDEINAFEVSTSSADGFAEGQRTLKEHLHLERSASLVASFKASLRDFRCIVCGFDFEAAYGEIGRGFVEAHHVEPLSARGFGHTSIDDLVAVCANCHRMLHRQWPPITPEALRARLRAVPNRPAL